MEIHEGVKGEIPLPPPSQPSANTQAHTTHMPTYILPSHPSHQLDSRSCSELCPSSLEQRLPSSSTKGALSPSV